MNYVNKGKRDILIFPKFKNIEKIQLIREKYDELAQILPPHITLAFPFESDISNEKLKEEIMKILKSYHPFKIKCEGVSIHKDDRVNTYYMFLDIIEGKEIIEQIHNDIYKEILSSDKATCYSYEPHITLGNTKNPKENVNLEGFFETTVDTVIVESIGDNEESIIEFEIIL